MWFVILCSCKENFWREKKKHRPPHQNLPERCHSFKDWGLHTLQKCNALPWQNTQCSVNVNKDHIAQSSTRISGGERTKAQPIVLDKIIF